MTQDQIHHMDGIDLLAALPDRSVEAIISDPPYNATNLAFEAAIDWTAFWQQAQRVLHSPTCPVVLFSQQPFTTDLICSNRAWFRHEIVWEKNVVTGFLDANRRPLRCHENILVFAEKQPHYIPQMDQGKPYRNRRTGAASHYGKHTRGNFTNNGTRYPRSVLKFDVEPGRFAGYSPHPTQKPLALMEYLVRTYTRESETVVDPFCGSGTTALAAHRTGRHFIAGDARAPYVEIARERSLAPWQRRNLRAQADNDFEDLPLFRGVTS